MSKKVKRFSAVGTATALAAATLSLLSAGTAHASGVSGIVNTASGQLGSGPCGNGGAGYYAPGSGQNSSCGSGGKEAQAWCADFAGWVWAQNGVQNLGVLNDLANSFRDYANDYDGGLSATPQVGDAVFFHPNSFSGTNFDHVAIVTAVHANGTIDWIGGNQDGIVSPDTNMPGTVGADEWTSHGYAVDLQGYAKPVGVQLPAIMRVDTLVNGDVYDNQRNADGSWGGVSLLDGNGQITQIATAALTDGTFHVDTLAGGKVYDDQRNPDGTWTGAALLDGGGQVSAISAAGLADGTMHVQTLAAGKVYDNQRNTDGTWTGAALLDGGGQVSAISAAGLTDGTLHVQTLAAGKVYDDQRNPDGTWTGAALLDGGGQVSAISAAGLADGTMHVQTLAAGQVYDNQRNTNGTWTGAALLDGNGHITGVSAAGLADGTMHVQTLAAGKVYDNQRNTNGTWTGVALLDGNGHISSISAAGFGE
ncbi:CHAP domain-containing protein [Kitasatospora sp. NBC_01287]|uniref:CHAP domain-containing protein n=1 Tax=Kitasatospora sp. NBC_01287 TaxID=2903573 RepID=UPI00225C2EFF|nr:CHAP domain-containing protein [Kitasatospora sp. NBC_01287]MCX4745400.1 CHAP domain-containing protein [Kitasatospora sp. NBC_01287]